VFSFKDDCICGSAFMLPKRWLVCRELIAMFRLELTLLDFSGFKLLFELFTFEAAELLAFWEQHEHLFDDDEDLNSAEHRAQQLAWGLLLSASELLAL